MSLRINDLPSNCERQKAFLDAAANQQRSTVSPIPEVSPQPLDTVSEFCKELSQGLTLLSTKDSEDFLNFERLANGIISGTVQIPANIPQPPTTTASPVSSQYRPLVSAPNSSIPIGTAIPMQHQKSSDDLIPTRFNSLVAVTTHTTLTSITESVAEAPLPKTPPSTPQKIVPIETVTPLPKAEQWLNEIQRKTSPSPRRAFQLQSRSKSIATESLFDRPSEWSPVRKPPEIHSTNPFISPTKQPKVTQTFQVQL